jgi:PAS domain S-box-containing protein
MSATGTDEAVDILLVDDQPANLLALEAVLSELGQNLVPARSGPEALARLAEHDFAVVLLDVQMEGLDGFETAKRIREREPSRLTPIIFLTAYDDDPRFSPAAAYALGAVDYLVKPVVPGILRAKVTGFLELFRKTQRATRAEANTREELRHLAAIVESSDDGIFSLDLEGTIKSWNRGAERLYGYSAGEVVGRHVALLVPPDRADDSDDILARIRRGEALEHFETRRRRKDGTVIDVSVTASPMRNATGAVIGTSKVARDITREKRAAERQRLRAEAGRILGASLDYETTLADVCRLVVPGFADWCALDLVDDNGLPRRIHIAHKDPAMVAMAEEFRKRYPPRPDDRGGVVQVLRTGRPVVVPEVTDELLVQSARDEEHLQILRGVGLRAVLIVPLAVSGRTIGALTLVMAESSRRFDDADLALATEIAARAALAVEHARLFAQAQDAIRVRDEALALHRGMDEKLTLLVEASSSLSASLDLPSVLNAVLVLSRRSIAADAYAVWRYRSDPPRWGIEVASGLSDEYQAATVAVHDDTPRMPDAPVVAQDVLDHGLTRGRAGSFELEGIRSLMSLPLRVRGQLTGSLVFYYRTQHQFSEIEIRAGTALSNLVGSAISTAELYQELRDNDRRKDEFLAMLAHELRNPLSAISNAVRLARQARVEDETLVWSQEVIERQAGKLARLIDDLLDVSRITRGKIQLKTEPVDARRVLQSAIEAVRPLIDERTHELAVSTGPGSLRLEADPVRLEQILINLITNAAKYTDPGGRIAVGLERVDDEVVFTVRDNGMGIAPELLPNVFDLFAQGERSVARSEGGLGIGLTIVRKLVEMHGGSVSASSAGAGQGSIFIVRLSASAEGPARTAPATADAPQAAGRSARILIVDDNADTARGLARLLKLLGHEVATAHDGPSAIDAAESFQPSVVLLDIGLPGMSGYEVASRLRAEDFGRNLLIVAVSGYGQDEDRRRSREAGFDYHLVKPIDHDALLTLLAR